MFCTVQRALESEGRVSGCGWSCYVADINEKKMKKKESVALISVHAQNSTRDERDLGAQVFAHG
jgi:peptide methionine sulfoxide reductase MsrB